jgi:DNA-binding NtrC family response regulator
MNSSSSILVGESGVMRRLRLTIERIAPSTIPVLIEGPTGAGKELAAALLHRLSGRSGAMIAFNVCAIAETMFEDALFGHVRGAYTGAGTDTPGFLREAHAGTLFLDEIGGLPATLQPKLLRAIETGVFRPIGSARDSRSDFRLVAATNEPLQDLVDTGRFRPDLAHRVSGVVLTLPPLDARRDDIPHLVVHFANGRGVDPNALRLLQSRDWPGNVRELKQVVDSAFVFGRGVLDARAIEMSLAHRPAPSVARRAAAEGSDYLTIERARLIAALERAGWDTILVAKSFGVHRSTLYRRIKRLNINLPPMMRPRPHQISVPAPALLVQPPAGSGDAPPRPGVPLPWPQPERPSAIFERFIRARARPRGQRKGDLVRSPLYRVR